MFQRVRHASEFGVRGASHSALIFCADGHFRGFFLFLCLGRTRLAKTVECSPCECHFVVCRHCDPPSTEDASSEVSVRRQAKVFVMSICFSKEPIVFTQERWLICRGRIRAVRMIRDSSCRSASCLGRRVCCFSGMFSISTFALRENFFSRSSMGLMALPPVCTNRVLNFHC